MLSNAEQFATLEEMLKQNGTIQNFEESCGKIKGRMMITLTDIPEELHISAAGSTLHAFECSFDFYDTTLGIALYTDTLRLAGGMWATPQKENAETPPREWMDFFLETLISHISEDGSFGCPMYSFVNDTSDLTLVPEKPEEP